MMHWQYNKLYNLITPYQNDNLQTRIYVASIHLLFMIIVNINNFFIFFYYCVYNNNNKKIMTTLFIKCPSKLLSIKRSNTLLFDDATLFLLKIYIKERSTNLAMVNEWINWCLLTCRSLLLKVAQVRLFLWSIIKWGSVNC